MGVYHKIANYETNEFVVSLLTTQEYAFVGTTNSIEIVDISNPINPIFVNSFVTGHAVCNIKLYESTVIFISNMMIYIIDISDMNNLAELSTYEVINGTWIASNFDIFDTYILLPMHSNGIDVIDISDLSTPTHINNFPISYRIDNLNINENILIAYGDNENYDSCFWIYEINSFQNIDLKYEYLITMNNEYCNVFDSQQSIFYILTNDNEITAFDISNIDEIEILGQINHHADNMFIDDSILSVHAVNLGYVEIDVSDLTNPYAIERYSTNMGMYAGSICKQAGFLYHSDPDGFAVIDISNPTNELLLSSFNDGLSSGSSSSFADNDILYIVGWDDSLDVYDISEPESPSLLSSIYIEHIRKIKTYDNIGYVKCSHGDDRFLNIYDFSDVLNPILESEIQIVNGSYTRYHFYNNYLYIADDEFKIYNVQDPSNPILVCTLDNINDSECIDTQDNILYISNYPNIEFYDITNPECPSLINSYNEFAFTFSVFENYLYYFDYVSFKIIDISDLYNPILISEIFINDMTYPQFIPIAKVIGNNLIFSDPLWNKIYSYNISDPFNPSFVSEFNWNISSAVLDIHNQNLIIRDNFNGVFIIDNNTFVSVSENNIINTTNQLINYPNPFNPETTISYELLEADEVELNVYNIKGQKIKSLVDEFVDLGSHTVQWFGDDRNGNPVSSGIYF